MAAATIPRVLPVYVAGGRSPGWWGMLLLIANEAAIFACLLFAYWYIRASAFSWPLGNIAAPDLTLPIPMTAVLVLSSIPMWFADRSLEQGAIGRMRIALLIAFLLGVAFIGMQIVEYTRKDFLISTNAWGSLFYGITGIHGIHVLIALYMNLIVQIRAALGHFSPRRRLAVQNVTLYWHFVDAVWFLGIFPSLYLAPHFL